jgi:hypothetical protein
MKIRDKQSYFAYHLAHLIIWIYSHPGWEVTLGEGSIEPTRKEHLHMEGSLHRMKLAQDINLFINGQWIYDGSHPAWTTIGEHWEQQHKLARWGGRFNDSNHFSFTHNGKA